MSTGALPLLCAARQGRRRRGRGTFDRRATIRTGQRRRHRPPGGEYGDDSDPAEKRRRGRSARGPRPSSLRHDDFDSTHLFSGAGCLDHCQERCKPAAAGTPSDWSYAGLLGIRPAMRVRHVPGAEGPLELHDPLVLQSPPDDISHPVDSRYNYDAAFKNNNLDGMLDCGL